MKQAVARGFRTFSGAKHFSILPESPEEAKKWNAYHTDRQPRARLLDRARDVMCTRHLSLRTEKTSVLRIS